MPPITTHTTSSGAGAPGKGGGGRRASIVVLAGDRMGEMFPLGPGVTAIGRGLTADVRINDEGISRTHATVVLKDDVYTLVDNSSTNGSFANGERVLRHALAEGDRIQLGANCVFRFTYRDDTEEDLQRRLFESALRDRQTGLFNRGYFLNRLESDVTVALRQGKALSLVFVAVDEHEALLDRLGQVGGEHLLRALAQRIQAITREDDVLARYGDAVIGLTCRWVDAMRASRAAARIREAVASEPFEIAGQDVAITLSLGVADLGMLLEATADALAAAADAAMQQACRAGGDRVELYDPENESTHHT